AFIDGCCKSVPSRRFSDLREAVAALEGPGRFTSAPTAPSVTTPPAPFPPAAPATPPRDRGLLGRLKALLWAGIAVGLAAAAGWVTFRGGGVAEDHERGFGDTVIR